MDFLKQSHTNLPNKENVSANTVSAPPERKSNNGGLTKGLRIISVVLLFSTTILVLAVLWSIVIGSPTRANKFVNTSKLQAVFLNGGQVYFGNIRTLNDQYIRLVNIYYLRVNQQVQPNQSTQNQSQNVSLVKLGCELHGPEDQMIINQSQVMFWENLTDTGQVAKAVQQFVQQNPNGQTCSQASTSSTGSTSNTTTTTPSTTTKP